MKLASFWLPHKHPKSISPLLRLIDDPEKVATNHSFQCLDLLGAEAIRFILNQKDLDRTYLYLFCHETFHEDTSLEELKRIYKDNPTEIVEWFNSQVIKDMQWIS